MPNKFSRAAQRLLVSACNTSESFCQQSFFFFLFCIFNSRIITDPYTFNMSTFRLANIFTRQTARVEIKHNSWNTVFLPIINTILFVSHSVTKNTFRFLDVVDLNRAGLTCAASQNEGAFSARAAHLRLHAREHTVRVPPRRSDFFFFFFLILGRL